MGESNKKRKKRVKRQLKKRIRQTAASYVVFSFRNVENLKKEDQTRQYQQRENELIKRTKRYQIQLDRIYEGNVKPMTRYVNDKSSLQHRCEKCGSSFWTKPMHQLKYESMRHVCGGNSKLYRLNEITVRSSAVKKIITEEDKKEMLKLYKQGVSYRQIASQFNISHATVSKYVKELI